MMTPILDLSFAEGVIHVFRKLNLISALPNESQRFSKTTTCKGFRVPRVPRVLYQPSNTGSVVLSALGLALHHG
jgi:hypothetical protein